MNRSKIGFLAVVLALIVVFSLTSQSAAQTKDFSGVAVFAEAGFPVADAAAPSPGQLENILPGAYFAGSGQLAAVLKDSATRTLVLPYGSAFPEQAWPDIFHFLQHGGNLVVLGGRPFTRSAYHDNAGWHLREYSVRFIRPLMIDQYQSTPSSDGMEFQDNPDITLKLPPFTLEAGIQSCDPFERGRFVSSRRSCRLLDARLDALAWGVKAGRKLSAPAIEVDHIHNGFDGGRWIIVNAELLPISITVPTPRLRYVRLWRARVMAAKSSRFAPFFRFICPGNQFNWIFLHTPQEPAILGYERKG